MSKGVGKLEVCMVRQQSGKSGSCCSFKFEICRAGYDAFIEIVSGGAL